MDSKELKKTFSKIAKDHGFEGAFGAWFKVSSESIVVLELQKSNFGDYYDMNVKIYVQGIFGISYSKSKELVRDTGDIFIRQPEEYKSVFDFDEPIDDEKRRNDLIKLFNEFIIPLTDKSLNKLGIRELADKGMITLLPAIKAELF